MKYSYEMVIIDQQGKSEITTTKSLSNAISYSEKIWKNATITQNSNDYVIDDEKTGINLKISKVNGSESVFNLIAESNTLETLETFKSNLIYHINTKLNFASIKFINDSASETLALEILPLIKNIENATRKLVLKTTVLNTEKELGLSKSTLDKLKKRKENFKNNQVDIDNLLSLTDFDDLSELLQTNTAIDSNFKTKWQKLQLIREKAITNAILVSDDLKSVQELSKEINDFVSKQNINVKVSNAKVAEPEPTNTKNTKVESFSTPEPPKESVAPAPEIQKETLKPTITIESTKVEFEVTKTAEVIEPKVQIEEVKAKIEEIKPIVAEVKSTPPKNFNMGFDMINENTFLSELKQYESVNSGKLINLKEFVNNILAEKGFAAGSCYSASKNLSESGKVTLFETKDDVGLTVKGIRSN